MINSNTLTGTIRRGFLDAAYIWKQEFHTIFKDLGVMIFLFILPLGYPVMYGLIYNTQVVRDIPVVVIDDSRSTLSREYCRMLNAAPQINIISYSANMDEAKSLMASGKAYGIVYIGRDFEKDIYRGNSSHINLYTQMNSMLIYRGLLMASTDVVGVFNDEVKKRGLAGATVTQESISIQPVKSSYISVYNPTGGFASFIMPAVEVLVIQQSLLLAIGMIAGTHRERNKSHLLIPHNHRYFGTFRIIFGKSLCYFTIAVLSSFWTMIAVPHIFSLPQLGDTTDIFLFVLPFILASIFMGMTLSVIIRGREYPMLLYVFLSMPFIFMSGVSWPWSAVPKGWQVIASMVPSTFATQGFIQINTTGASLNQVSFYYLWEWGLCLFYFFTTFVVYRIMLRKEMRSIIKQPQQL